MVIVGAGAAGLSCARSLASLGVQVIVLEAQDRVGGRIRTLHHVDEAIELGAQVIHGSRACTWNLVQEAGLTTYPLRQGEQLLVAVDRTVLSALEVAAKAGMPPWAAENLLSAIEPPDDPVVEVLAATGLSGIALRLAITWISQVWAADPADLSAAGVARIHRAWEAGGGQFVVHGGYDQIPHHLARELDIRTASPVSSVQWRRERVVATTPHGEVQGQAAVITVPPPVVASGRLRFDPPLPKQKVTAAEEIWMGDALVTVARMREPASRSVWGLVTGSTGGFWRISRGSTLLMGWMKGPCAGRVRKRRLAFATAKNALSLLAPEAPPLHELLAVADWGGDPWAAGAYTYPRAGRLGLPRVWAAPVGGALLFAGESTCGDRHPGMVHGALESGSRAAQEVALLLGTGRADGSRPPLVEPSRDRPRRVRVMAYAEEGGDGTDH